MSYITELSSDGSLNTALANFNALCVQFTAQLSLQPADLIAIAAAASQFNTALNAATAAKQTSKGSVEAKDVQKAASKAVIAKYAKIFRANPAVSDQLLEQLMLPHHKTPGAKTPPTQPLDLVGSADGQGLVTLKWKRSGNIEGTNFLVEARTAPTGEWTIMGSTTRVKTTFQGTPGDYLAFRVTAVRNKQSSPPSVPFVLWDGSTGEGFELKVA
ncbi:MAG: fibronectin type III domain-containing protein [Armatimonadetes bacterium]|nr:fibronectin type III domain-containing protein [Armatimonadota bacterium]